MIRAAMPAHAQRDETPMPIAVVPARLQNPVPGAPHRSVVVDHAAAKLIDQIVPECRTMFDGLPSRPPETRQCWNARYSHQPSIGPDRCCSQLQPAGARAVAGRVRHEGHSAPMSMNGSRRASRTSIRPSFSTTQRQRRRDAWTSRHRHVCARSGSGMRRRNRVPPQSPHVTLRWSKTLKARRIDVGAWNRGPLLASPHELAVGVDKGIDPESVKTA